MLKNKNDSKFAKENGELHRIYGEMWRSWPTRKGKTIDQLKWVIQELKDDPDAKNLIVNSWNPEYLYTMATNEDASRFPICHNMYQVSNREVSYPCIYISEAQIFSWEYLSISQVMRFLQLF